METDDGDAASQALPSPAMIPCSICLEAVTDGGGRSTARLLCGHRFHLGRMPVIHFTLAGHLDDYQCTFDCIGSAFNAKGMMQCPNCRKVEKGDWLYANGCLSFREASVDDWTYDEDLYDLNFSEMSYGVHWCPFTRLSRVASSFEENESPSMSYHSLDGHRAVFSVHPPSSVAHSCPYLAYLYPLQPSSSNSQASHPFPTVDIHYHRREAHLPPFSHLSSRINVGEQATIPSITMTTRHDSDGHMRHPNFMHPFIVRHGLVSGASTSTDTAVPPYLGNTHAQSRVQDLHGPYQQQGAVGMNAATVSSTRRPGGSRTLASRAAPEHSAFYLFPSTSSSAQSQQDADATGASHFYAWERDQFSPFPLMPVERGGSTWWGPLQQPPRPSDPGNQTGPWHQHVPERSSQGLSEGFSHQPLHPPHMYPFI